MTPVDVAIPPPREFSAWEVDAGTEAILVEDHRVPLVSITLRVPIGTWSESFRDLAAEEAWEHLAWDPEGALRARADALGAELAVWTSSDECGVRVKALADDAEAATDLLRDVIHNTDYDKRELRRSTRSGRVGYRTAEKDPRFLLRRTVDDLFWTDDDPRAQATRDAERSSRDVKRLARATARVLAMPGRIVGFAGDLDPDEAAALVGRLDLPALGEPIDGPSYDEPRVPSAELHVEEAPGTTQVYFGWARPSFPYTDARYPALVLASYALGGNYYSRLTVALRHDEGDTYSVSVSRGTGEVADVFGITTYTRPDNADALAAKVEVELERFVAEGLTEQERAEAISAMRGSALFGLQHPEGRLGQVLWARMHGVSPDFARESVEAAAALSLDEVNAFVAEFFQPEAFTRIRVVPEGE